MKKIKLLLFACILFIPPGLFAQDGGTDNGFLFGIKAGGVYSTFRTDYQFKFAEHRYGPAGGISIGYKFSSKFGFHVDAMYVQEGASYVPSDYIYYEPVKYADNDEIRFNRLNSNVILHMVETPLFLDFYFGSGNIRPRIFVGASYNYLLSAEAKNKLYVYDYNEDYYAFVDGRATDYVTSKFKDYYIGGILGAALHFDAFGLDNQIEGRLKVGAQPINNLATLKTENRPNVWEIPESYYKDVSVTTFMVTYGINF